MMTIWTSLRLYKHVLALALATALVTACQQTEPARYQLMLGTVCSVNAYEDGTAALYDRLFSRLRQIEKTFSLQDSDSELNAINAAAGSGPVAISKDMYTVLSAALSLAEASDGALNPAIGPLVRLWGIQTAHARVPSSEEIAAVLPLCDWHDILLDSQTVFLRKAGMVLDTGAIAKGFAADELVAILQAEGVKRAVINLGGNVYVYGEKADKSPWQVGIKNPLAPEGMNAVQLSLPETSIVTSGTYERYFEADGIRYHHLLDSNTGCPAETGLLAVTIVCDSSLLADALSTALFVAGQEKGIALLHRYPQAQALWIREDCRISISPGLLDQSMLLLSEFTLQTAP